MKPNWIISGFVTAGLLTSAVFAQESTPSETVPAPAAEQTVPEEKPSEVAAETPAVMPPEDSAAIEAQNPAPEPAAAKLQQPKPFVQLNDFCPTTETVILAPWGDLLVACPNTGKPDYPAMIIRITPENKVYPWMMVPVDPESGVATPAGMAFSPDGNLYIADAPYLRDGKSPGRVLRIIVNEKHRPVGCQVAAYNFGFPNDIKVFEQYIYVTDSCVEKQDGKMMSGVYRFSIDAKSIKVTNSVKDPYIFGIITTNNPDSPIGADGLCFNADGDLFVGNFGDGQIYKITFDMERIPAAPVLFAQGEALKSTDGLVMGEDGNLYTTDFVQNAVVKIDPQGAISVIAQNDDAQTRPGALHKPSSLCFRGKELIISNYNCVPGAASSSQNPAEMSVITLP